MASHTHIPSFPHLDPLIERNPDGSYDCTKADRAIEEWREAVDQAVDAHNRRMRKPWWFRMLTGYKNPEPVPHAPEVSEIPINDA